MTHRSALQGAAWIALVIGLTFGTAPQAQAEATTGTAAATSPAKPAAVAEVHGLPKAEIRGFDEAFVRPGFDFAAVRSLTLGPVAIAVERDRDDLELTEREARHATSYFGEKLRDALDPVLMSDGTAGTAGQGAAGRALRLDITLTEFLPNRSYHARRGDGRIVDRAIAVGGAAFQAVLTDVATGEVVAVLADDRRGLPLDINTNVFTLYGDADQAMRRWARRMAELVVPAGNS